MSDSNLQQSIKVRDTISRMSFYDNTLPLVLLNKGEPGTIPVGAQIRALTISETEIEI